ncbi:MAG: hypothetical protein JRD00_07180 [Deltaproteobacteria bacterium]|nr:hypothetical protein [Deltaproteobacteria bacterium]
MSTLLKLEQSREHPLKDILEGALGLSGMDLRQELRWLGHNVFPGKLGFMLSGIEPMPPDIEAALRRIAAEHLEGRPLTQEQADQVIEWWLRTDDDEPDEDTGERQRSAREFDRRYNELLEAYDDPKRLGKLVTEF